MMTHGTSEQTTMNHSGCSKFASGPVAPSPPTARPLNSRDRILGLCLQLGLETITLWLELRPEILVSTWHPVWGQNFNHGRFRGQAIGLGLGLGRLVSFNITVDRWWAYRILDRFRVPDRFGLVDRSRRADPEAVDEAGDGEGAADGQLDDGEAERAAARRVRVGDVARVARQEAGHGAA